MRKMLLAPRPPTTPCRAIAARCRWPYLPAGLLPACCDIAYGTEYREELPHACRYRHAACRTARSSLSSTCGRGRALREQV